MRASCPVRTAARRRSARLGQPRPFAAAFRGTRSPVVAARWEGLIAAICTREAEQQCALYTLPCGEGVGC